MQNFGRQTKSIVVFLKVTYGVHHSKANLLQTDKKLLLAKCCSTQYFFQPTVYISHIYGYRLIFLLFTADGQLTEVISR